MTQPTPEDAKAGAEKAKAAQAPKFDVLTVGHFVHRDHILGGEHDRFGVVLKQSGDVLIVRPLADHTMQVDASGFTPLTADDVTGYDD